MFKKCKKIKIVFLSLALFFGQSFAILPFDASANQFTISGFVKGALEEQVSFYVLTKIASLYDKDTISGRTAVGGVVAAGLLYSWYYKINLFSMKNRLFGVIRSSPGAIKTFVNDYPITSSAVAISAAYGGYSYMNGSNTTSDTIKILSSLKTRVTIFSYMELFYNSLRKKNYKSQSQAQDGQSPAHFHQNGIPQEALQAIGAVPCGSKAIVVPDEHQENEQGRLGIVERPSHVSSTTRGAALLENLRRRICFNFNWDLQRVVVEPDRTTTFSRKVIGHVKLNSNWMPEFYLNELTIENSLALRQLAIEN